MAEKPSLSYYLPIAGGRIIGFIPFPWVLVLCEMQSVSSRIWTRIAVFISYGDNDYTTGTSKGQLTGTTSSLSEMKKYSNLPDIQDRSLTIRYSLASILRIPHFLVLGGLIHQQVIQLLYSMIIKNFSSLKIIFEEKKNPN